jgi:hypothetical protein
MLPLVIIKVDHSWQLHIKLRTTNTVSLLCRRKLLGNINVDFTLID